MKKVLIDEDKLRYVLEALEGMTSKGRVPPTGIVFNKARVAYASLLEVLSSEAPQPAKQEDVTSQFDIKTSKGGRGFVEWYFKSVLNRHDFTRYIRTDLAADFSCALAAGLSTSPQPAQQEPLTNWVAVSDRLPLEEDGDVQVRMRDGRCEIAWAIYRHGARKASTKFSRWGFPDLDEDEAPTHWMPIPSTNGIKEGGAQ